jgi:hypothetical protein
MVPLLDGSEVSPIEPQAAFFAISVAGLANVHPLKRHRTSSWH